jgi:hypothetical protein
VQWHRADREGKRRHRKNKKRNGTDISKWDLSSVCAAARCSSGHEFRRKRNTTDLIMYGTMDANMHAKAAHRIQRPGPACTTMPRGVLNCVWITKPFTSWDIFAIAVHIAAAMRRSTVARTAKLVDSKNV